MKNLILILLFISSSITAQYLQPIIGLGFTGGLSYDMEHEVPSAKLGLVYTPKNENIITNLELSGSYYYNILREKKQPINTFYVLKLQASKEIFQYWNITAYSGYINSFDNDLMKPYRDKLNHTSNLAWGMGIQTFDDYITGELLYENFAGYSHISMGVRVNLWDLLGNKDK